ncbi:MAG: AraC family transcriptional regulator [Bacilli bacterium]|nr:AraC family transcriptional regulator [Bacilli bacterium]
MKIHLENSDIRRHYVVNKTTRHIDGQLLYSGLFNAVKRFEDMHEHPFYEFLLITSGTGTMKTSNGTLELSKGDIAIYPPHTMHIEKAHSKTGMTANFFAVKSNKNLESVFGKEIRIGKTGNDYMNFVKTFDVLINCSQNAEANHSQEAASAAAALLLALIDKALSTKAESNDGVSSTIHKVKDYVDQNYCNNIHIDEIGKKYGLSEFYLCRCFKDYFGVTLKRYVIEKRIDKAKELLANEENDLDDIGRMVSYNDKYYFNRLFKMETGTSLSNYRSRIIKKP